MTLETPELILDDITGGPSHNGSRMVIRDDKLYISIGDSYLTPDLAQDLSSNNGKILRLNLDGTVPDDNPISGSYIWSFGHRNPQGLCKGNGRLYSSEHGTFTDDEINIIQENRNFGWPEVEGNCDLIAEEDFCASENVAEPIYSFTPSIAPCGIDFYNHTSIPEWQNSLLLTTLKDEKFIQLQLSESGDEILETNEFLTEDYGRLRDVLVVPDGRIFICTSNNDYAGVPNPNDDVIIELQAQIDDSVFDLTKESTRFKIAPNPVREGTLRLLSEISDVSPSELKIYNLQGKAVKEFLVSTQNIIDVSELNNGVYYLQIRNKQLIETIRFIKEN